VFSVVLRFVGRSEPPHLMAANAIEFAKLWPTAVTKWLSSVSTTSPATVMKGWNGTHLKRALNSLGLSCRCIRHVLRGLLPSEEQEARSPKGCLPLTIVLVIVSWAAACLLQPVAPPEKEVAFRPERSGERALLRVARRFACHAVFAAAAMNWRQRHHLPARNSSGSPGDKLRSPISWIESLPREARRR
jgi:hypothetical protein